MKLLVKNVYDKTFHSAIIELKKVRVKLPHSLFILDLIGYFNFLPPFCYKHIILQLTI